MAEFKQLCVWPGTYLGDETAKDFEDFFKNEYGVTVKFAEEVETLPDVVDGKPLDETGGRHDIFFYIASEDISVFAISRLAMGIRWWEDVIGNGGGSIYPQSILDKYPVTW